jgi:hypothetical protein
LSGILRIPIDCYRHREYRRPVAWHTLKRFLLFRRASARKPKEGSLPVGRSAR